MEDRIKRQIASLVRLAKRPGTPQEGETARQMAIQLSLKYGIVCEFTAGGRKPTSARPTASAPPPVQTQQPQSEASVPSPDMIFYQWIKALASYGWCITQTLEVKSGRQIRFRKPGFNSEIRVTQRHNSDGKDFDAEHIMRPDPDADGKDWSYCTYMTIYLGELLNHIAYTKDVEGKYGPAKAWNPKGKNPQFATI